MFWYTVYWPKLINCRQTNVRTYRVVFYGCHHVGCSHMLSSYTAAKQSQTSGATANVQATNDHDANLPILSRARACVGFLREGENGECRHYILKFASRCADNYAQTDQWLMRRDISKNIGWKSNQMQHVGAITRQLCSTITWVILIKRYWNSINLSSF